MNKKGFTLVELLATIIILGLLALIASTSVTKVIKDSKGDLYTTQIKLVESAAKAWGADNIDKLPDAGECKYLTIENLQNYGLIDKDITNPKTGQKIDTNIKIKISTSKTGYGNSVTNYEIDPVSVDGCSHAMPCQLSSDSEKKGKELGAKYECEVKPGTIYTFYVLSHEDDGTTNLIMDRNICSDGSFATSTNTCLVSWTSRDYLEEYAPPEDILNDENKNIYGPVTAMEYLSSGTKTWTNTNELTINKFTDETGTTHPMTEYVSNARMPYYSEVTSFDTTKNNVYLYENLDGNYWDYDESTKPTNNINNIYGYWTLSSHSKYSSSAWNVHYDGNVDYNRVDFDIINLEDSGVRPVINIKL